jgi:hypothetical protein
VGYEAGLISQDLFTMLVVMALVTTMMTGPLLRRTYPDRRVARDIAEAERARLGGDAAAYRVLVVAEPDRDNTGLLDVALALADSQRPAEIVVASLPRQQTSRLDVGSGLSDELAAIASSMERLEALVRRGAEHDIPVRISSHLSADPTADVVTIIEAIVPQIVIVAGTDENARSLPDVVEIQLVTVARGDLPMDQSDGFTVTWSQGESHDLSVAFACRLGAFTNVPVHIESAPGASERRFAGMRKSLSTRGVELSDTRSELSLRVGGQAPADIVVRAERDAVPVEWSTVDLGAARQPS